MKKSLLFFGLLLTFMFCSQNKYNRKLTYDAEVIFYRLNGGQKYSDKIMIDHYSSSDSISFTYKYHKLREKDDRLVFFKDSILFNKNKLLFISKKNKNGIEIEKYLCEYDNSSLHIFLNKEKGLLVTRNRFNNVVVEYHIDTAVDSLQYNYSNNSSIINDSLFFNVY